MASAPKTANVQSNFHNWVWPDSIKILPIDFYDVYEAKTEEDSCKVCMLKWQTHRAVISYKKMEEFKWWDIKVQCNINTEL